MNVFSRKGILFIWAVMLLGVISLPVRALHAEDKPIAAGSLSYNFYDMKFVDAQNGWVCGKSGLMYRTQDGGATWHKVETNVDDSLFGMAFLNKTRAIVVGQAGLVMASDDLGRSWTKVGVPTDKAMLTVDFFDENHGMAAGDWGKIIATQDGGRTWQEVSLEEDLNLYGIKFTGPEEAWIAAEMGNLFHTLDGGKTWEKKNVADGALFSIDFDGRGNGLAVGLEGWILFTKDGGATWDKRNISKESLYNVKFNENSAFIVGDAGTVLGMMVKADNTCGVGDGAWQQVEVPVDLHANWLGCIGKRDGRKIVVGGARGSICFIEELKMVSPPGL